MSTRSGSVVYSILYVHSNMPYGHIIFITYNTCVFRSASRATFPLVHARSPRTGIPGPHPRGGRPPSGLQGGAASLDGQGAQEPPPVQRQVALLDLAHLDRQEHLHRRIPKAEAALL